MKAVNELRQRWPTAAIARMFIGGTAWILLVNACKSLGIEFSEMSNYWLDVLFEAIEAADALGL